MAKVIAYIVFVIFTFLNLYPVYWILMSSLKTNKEFMENIFALPKGFAWENYANAWKESRISVYFFNSLYVTAISIIFILVLSLLISYCLARFKFRARPLLYGFFLLGMLVPVHATLVPIFNMFNSVGMLNKWYTLFLPYIGFGMPFAIYVLESFIKMIPDAIDEAAAIDGCSRGRLLFQIIAPLCGPALATVSVMSFFNVWNDFIWPLILITDNNLKTIQLGLQNFIGPRSANYAQLMAALSIATFPVLIIYFIFQKQITKGLAAGAVKG